MSENTLKTIYDIQQLLKKFGTFVYVGDRLLDLELMEMEIKELYESKLIQAKDFQSAILLLRREISIEKENRNR